MVQERSLHSCDYVEIYHLKTRKVHTQMLAGFHVFFVNNRIDLVRQHILTIYICLWQREKPLDRGTHKVSFASWYSLFQEIRRKVTRKRWRRCESSRSSELKKNSFESTNEKFLKCHIFYVQRARGKVTSNSVKGIYFVLAVLFYRFLYKTDWLSFWEWRLMNKQWLYALIACLYLLSRSPPYMHVRAKCISGKMSCQVRPMIPCNV